MTNWRKLLQEAKSPEEKNDILSAMREERQRECPHINCRPIEWYWSGQVRTMHCEDCNLKEFREEVDNG